MGIFRKYVVILRCDIIKTRDMRSIFLSILFCLPMLLAAQTDWEAPQQTNTPEKRKANVRQGETEEYKYAKYLGDVVPMKDGEVVWERTYENNKDAETNYTVMLNFLTGMSKEDGQLPESRVALVSKSERKIVCNFAEWLVFSSTVLSLDRTEMDYTLSCECYDNKVVVTIFRIKYVYEENRHGGQRFTAEEWITDKYALNKKKTKLAKFSGKFRRCTVDRMDMILDNIGVVIQ